MKHQTITLVKFKALQKRLQAPLCHVVGYLESLWLFAQINARDGDLSKFTALELAGWIEYPGDPSELIEALVETRWLDRETSESGVERLSIHDWEQHCPNWLKGISSRSENPGRFQPGPGPSTGAGPLPSSGPGTGPGPLPGNGPPNLTQPNHLDDDDLREIFRGLDSDSIRRNASRLGSVAGRVLDREFIWQVACVSVLVEPDLCEEIADKIRGGQVSKFKSYIQTAIRNACKSAKYGEWSQLRRLVPPPPPPKNQEVA
ncbi:MAG: hypothetical protein NXI32_17000 [bacterium]|nr:hypothetical protein [bacterium]